MSKDIKKAVVFTFGRMNPPSIGHEKVIAHKINQAEEKNADHYVYVSHTQDAKKNPLSPEEKVSYIKRAIPGVNVRSSTKEIYGPLQMAKELHSKGYQHLTMVAGSDRIDHYKTLLNKYNGPDKEYNFKSINVVSAGKRDDTKGGVAGMSGTKLRGHAVAGNKEIFKSGLISGLEDKHKEEIYNKVRSSMGVSEDTQKRIPFLLMTEKQKMQLLKPSISEEEIVNPLETEVPRTLLSFKKFLQKI